MITYSELSLLFLIVLLIYLVQCICWASPRAIIFSLGLRGRGKRRAAGFVWNLLDTAGFFADPLPPLAPLVVIQWPAFELTPDSIHFTPKEDQERVSVPWEKLEIKRTDTQILYNSAVIFKGSAAQVAQCVELLGQVQSA